MKTRIAGLFIFGAAALLGRGTSQAGSDYPGEPLMTLHGVVQSPAALSSDDLACGRRDAAACLRELWIGFSVMWRQPLRATCARSI